MVRFDNASRDSHPRVDVSALGSLDRASESGIAIANATKSSSWTSVGVAICLQMLET
jgi:hypothetical protein